MRSFVQLYIASFREFRRDVSALFWTFAFPVFFIFIFGIVFSGDGDIKFDLGVVNEDGEASARLVENFKQIGAFKVTTGDRTAEIDALKKGDRSAVIVIPAGTGAALESYMNQLHDGSPSTLPQTPLEVYYDPNNRNTAQVALNIISQVISGTNEDMAGTQPVLTLEMKKTTTKDIRNIDYLLPGILAMSLMQLGLFATAAPLVSLREKQVLRRMGATPLTRTVLLASQVAFRLTIAVMQTGIIIVVGMIMFNVHIEMGNLPAIIGIMLLGATLFITLGYFLSGLAKTEEAVQGLISIPNFLFMFLSGIFFPVSYMPGWIRPVVDAIPLTYVGDALRKTMIDAGSYYSLPLSLSIMTAWLAVCAVLAVKFFRWEPQG
jgi:ABC-2 type transport system permease protein